MSRTRVLWILGAVVVVAVGLVAVRHGASPASASVRGRRGGPPAVAVQAAPAQYGNLDTYLTLVGTVAPVTQLNVVAQITERVVSLPVKLGDTVHAGEVVAKLDASSLNAQLASAQASVQQAQAHLAQVEQGTPPATLKVDEANVSRAKAAMAQAKLVYDAAERTYKSETPVTPGIQSLYQDQQTLAQAKSNYDASVNAYKYAQTQLQSDQAPPLQSVVEQVQASVSQAEAQVASIRVQLGETVIHSALDGVVTALPAAVGTLAGPSAPLMTIQSNAPQINATVPQEQVNEVRAGDTAQVVLGVGGTPIPAHVTLVNPAGNTSTLTFPVVLVPDHPNAALMPGQSVKVELRTGHLQHVLIVPNAALQPVNGQNEVYVIQNGTARLQAIKIQAQSNSQVAVSSGLTAGEQVVVGPQEYLASGARVTIIGGAAGAAASAGSGKAPAKGGTS